MKDGILNPPVTRDTRVVVGDAAGRDAEIVRTDPQLEKGDVKNRYALAVRDVMLARLVSAVETLVEQNKAIVMYLESMDS